MQSFVLSLATLQLTEDQHDKPEPLEDDLEDDLEFLWGILMVEASEGKHQNTLLLKEQRMWTENVLTIKYQLNFFYQPKVPHNYEDF